MPENFRNELLICTILLQLLFPGSVEAPPPTLSAGNVFDQPPPFELSPEDLISAGKMTKPLSDSLGLSSLDRAAVVFLSANRTVVTAHAGSDVDLECRVRKESQFGMVSERNVEVVVVITSFSDYFPQGGTQ